MAILRNYCDSTAVNKLTDAEEVLFVRILQHADDHGRFHANPPLLKAALFPLKANKRVTDIALQLAACERAGVLRCYVDAQGRQLLQVAKWRDAKKYKRSLYPPPEGQTNFLLVEEKNNSPPVQRSRSRREVEGEPPPTEKSGNGTMRKREVWQLLRDEQSLTERIKKEAEGCKPDPVLLDSLKKARAAVRAEMKY